MVKNLSKVSNTTDNSPETVLSVSNVSYHSNLLLTAEIVVENSTTSENLKNCVVLDSSNQQTFVTNRLVDLLNLDCMTSDIITMYMFAPNKPKRCLTNNTEVLAHLVG